MSDSNFANKERSPAERFEHGEIAKRIAQVRKDFTQLKLDVRKLSEKVRKLDSNEDRVYYASSIKEAINHFVTNVEKIDWYNP